LWRLSATICAKNQALNENIDKVIRILRRSFQIDIFVLKSSFTSERLIFGTAEASFSTAEASFGTAEAIFGTAEASFGTAVATFGTAEASF
jgi:hypothetical protein